MFWYKLLSPFIVWVILQRTMVDLSTIKFMKMCFQIHKCLTWVMCIMWTFNVIINCALLIYSLTLCLPHYKSPVCHIILERTGIGTTFLEVFFSTRCIFLRVNRMEKPKSQINNACMCTVRTRNNGNRFIEQYEWTIGVYITVQTGERGNFTDMQIGERGKQRVKQLVSLAIWQNNKNE